MMAMNETKQSQLLSARRWFLKQLGSAVGAGAAATLVTSAGLQSAMAFSPKKESASMAGEVFSKTQMVLLREVCDTVLPRTDTPGAADVDCHGFIDHQLNQCHSTEEQQSVIAILEAIDQTAMQRHAKGFVALPQAERTQILTDVEAVSGFSDVLRTQFKFLKGLILFGYFTSEVGATQALAYQAVPGGYKGSIPMTPDTKSWGSLNFY